MMTSSYSREDVVKDGFVRVKTNVLGGILTVIIRISAYQTGYYDFHACVGLLPSPM